MFSRGFWSIAPLGLISNKTPCDLMGKNAVNIGQHYFHNEDLSEANIHGIIIIMS